MLSQQSQNMWKVQVLKHFAVEKNKEPQANGLWLIFSSSNFIYGRAPLENKRRENQLFPKTGFSK